MNLAVHKTDSSTSANRNAGGASGSAGKGPFFSRLFPCRTFEDCFSSGRSAMHDGKYLSAAHHFKAAAKKNPTSAEAHFLLGEALSQFCYLLADYGIPVSRHYVAEAVSAYESACCNESPVGNSQILYNAHYNKAKLIYDFRANDRLNEAFMSADSVACALDAPERGTINGEIDLLFKARALRDRIQSAINRGFEPDSDAQP